VTALPTYTPPLLLFNGHLETLYPALFRRVGFPLYERERLITDDDDFLDLDWVRRGHEELVIISHGLEGNTDRAYVKGMARALHEAGFDVLAWNYRGCSQEMNRRLRFYHSGATDDLDRVVRHTLRGPWRSIHLIGFSLGGNITLKFLGEHGTRLDARIGKALAFSTPVDLHSSCLQISRPQNRLYALRFLISLKEKIRRKAALRPDLDISNLAKIKTLIEFDDRYTGPLHGFGDAVDYYTKCSSLPLLGSIAKPTLLVNSRNDPFLSSECFPDTVPLAAPVQLIYPERGGHVGYTSFNGNGVFWSEQVAIDFLTN
jgi:hypothetical protein